ncbi:MAG TPA: hypothetical protein VIQ31_37935 [Phormidium sp.]
MKDLKTQNEGERSNQSNGMCRAGLLLLGNSSKAPVEQHDVNVDGCSKPNYGMTKRK